MKTRYRTETIGGLFSKKQVLVLQVLKHHPDGPNDYNGMPEYLAFTEWVDATVEDLQELLSELEEQARLLGMSAEREADLLGQIERLQREVQTERVLSFRNQVAELELLVTNLRQQIAHLNDDLAGVKSDVAYVTKQRDELIELYEKALKASWPEGAMGDAFEYWNAARAKGEAK